MGIRSRAAVVHGRDTPLQELHELRAGPLTAALDGVDLRYVKLGNVEIVRRIYVAVRDRNWNTIPAIASDIQVDARADSFEVGFTAEHSSYDTHFEWAGSITGTREGRIRFEMDGSAQRDMLYNRVGFCVLHPWAGTAGRVFRGETPNGPITGNLPRLVEPQRFENGLYVPLFPAVSRLAIELEDGISAVCEFEGDLFEMEDQRNWTDASFKTYCTPLALGYPRELKEGEELFQAVMVSARTTAPVPPDVPAPRIALGTATGACVPAVGLALPAETPETSEEEAALLAELGPAHLRLDLHLRDPDWRRRLEHAQHTCTRLGCALELALFLRDDQVDGLTQLAAALRNVEIARVLVTPEGAQTTTSEETTPAPLVELVRDQLSLRGVPIAGGTDMYFCELNRTRPVMKAMDGIFWSLNPQVHAFDDVSVLETAEAQGEQVRAAKAFAEDKPLFVGPVTLRRRYNVNATVAEESASEGLPDSVDPRQASLLGAVWTAASIKHLSEQGATSVTYFETVGWRGVLQGDSPPMLANEFPAAAGEVFPLFHPLADICALRGAEVLTCTSTRPLEVSGLATRRDDGATTLLLANLTPRQLRIELAGIAGGATVRRLNEASAELAAREPHAFRGSVEPFRPTEGIELRPYEFARIDIEKGAHR